MFLLKLIKMTFGEHGSAHARPSQKVFNENLTFY